MNYLTSLLLLSTNSFIQPTTTHITTTIGDSIVVETSTIYQSLAAPEYDLNEQNSSFIKQSEDFSSNSSSDDDDDDGEDDKFNSQSDGDTGSGCSTCDSTDNESDSDSEDDRVFVHGYTVTTTITTTTTSYDYYPGAQVYFQEAGNMVFFQSTVSAINQLQWGIPTTTPKKQHRHRTGLGRIYRKGAARNNNNFINRRVTVTMSITRYLSRPVNRAMATPIEQDAGRLKIGGSTSQAAPLRYATQFRPVVGHFVEPTSLPAVSKTSGIVSQQHTATHVLPRITSSIQTYPTNGEEVDDITFPINFFRTLIAGEYSILPIEGTTIYSGYPTDFPSAGPTSRRIIRPHSKKRRRPRSKTKTPESSTAVWTSSETSTSTEECETETTWSEESTETTMTEESTESTVVEESFETDMSQESTEPIPMEESMEIISIDTSMETTSTEELSVTLSTTEEAEPSSSTTGEAESSSPIGGDDSDDSDDDDSSSTSSSAFTSSSQVSSIVVTSPSTTWSHNEGPTTYASPPSARSKPTTKVSYTMTTITASPLTDVRVSHTKTRITESPLTDVTKIRISEVTIPTTTTTTRWIEVTPQLPTAAKSITSYKTSYQEKSTRSFSFPRFRTRKPRVSSSTIFESSQRPVVNSTSFHNTTAESPKEVIYETVSNPPEDPPSSPVNQHSFTGVVLPGRKFIFRSMSNLPNCDFSVYMLAFLLLVPLVGLLCL